MTFFRLAMVFLWSLLPQPVLGQSVQASEFYRVSGIRIDAQGADLVFAKQQGLEQAKREGLKTLLERMVIGADKLALPQMSEIEAMIGDTTIRDEAYGGDRYLAEVVLQFRPQGVRRYLRRLKVPFNETRASPVRLIPMTRISGIDMLPGLGNFVYQLWQEAQVAENEREVFRLVPWTVIGKEVLAKQSLSHLTEEGAGAPFPGSQQFAADYVVRLEIFSAPKTWPDQGEINARLVFFTRGSPEGLSASTRLVLSTEEGQLDGTPMVEWLEHQLESYGLGQLQQQAGDTTETTTLPLIIFSAEQRTSLDLRARLARAHAVEKTRLEKLTPTTAMLTATFRGSMENFQRSLAGEGVHIRPLPGDAEPMRYILELR